MFNKRKILSIIMYLSIVILVIVFAFGCQNADDKKEISDTVEEKGNTVSISKDVKNNELVQKAESIADNIVEVIGIEDATVIIFKDKVIVGVQLFDDKKLNKDIMEFIEEVVLETYKDAEETLITDNSKLFDKIDEIAISTIKGNKIDNYTDNINEIIKQIHKK